MKLSENLKRVMICSGVLLMTSNVVVTNNASALEPITNNLETKLTKDIKLDNFLEEAREVMSKEKNQLQSDEDQVFLYQLVDESTNELYFYENAMGEETVDIFELKDNNTDSSTDTLANLHGGIGARQYIPTSGHGTLTTTVTLPRNVESLNGTAYIYSGFTGTVESDMGLQFVRKIDGVNNAWVPYLKVGDIVFTDTGTNFAPGYNQVQYRNGFAPGADITFVVDSNYNGTGRARLKQMGYAIHAKLDGSGGTTYLTSIIEAKNSSGRPSKFKVLATVAGN